MRRGTGRGGVAALVLLAAVLAAAPAGAMMMRHTLGPVDRRIAARIEAGATRGGLAATAADWFVTFDQNDDGVIDWQDDALALQLHQASRRAMGVAFVLAMDLDGDGVVTEPEAIAFAVARRPASPTATRADLAGAIRVRIGPFDADKDGRVTLAEVLAAANASAVAGPDGEVPLAPEAAPLSRQAYNALVDALFTGTDADGNGVLSLERDPIKWTPFDR